MICIDYYGKIEYFILGPIILCAFTITKNVIQFII